MLHVVDQLIEQVSVDSESLVDARKPSIWFFLNACEACQSLRELRNEAIAFIAWRLRLLRNFL